MDYQEISGEIFGWQGETNYRGVGFQQEQFGYHSNGSKGWFLEQGPDVIV